MGQGNSSCEGTEGGLWTQQQLGLCIVSLLMTQSSLLTVNSYPPVSPEFQQHHPGMMVSLPALRGCILTPGSSHYNLLPPCQAPGPKAYEMLLMTGSVCFRISEKDHLRIPPCGAGPQQGHQHICRGVHPVAK